ncbi:MAG TPA: hypothetical protein VL501_00695 [Pyrinomonadaceae bacterium]|nr:hypothetical protein [Pyrinomonadaceae bacterium]
MTRETASRSVKWLTLLIFGISIPVAAQPDSVFKLPAGTHLRLSVDVELSSKVASVNDTFIARVTKAVKLNETVVLPEGALVEGRVTRVSAAGGFGRSGSMSIIFEKLNAFGGTRPIEGQLTNEIAPDKPFFLIACFVKGHEAKLKKGEEFEIEIKRDVPLPVTAY